MEFTKKIRSLLDKVDSKVFELWYTLQDKLELLTCIVQQAYFMWVTEAGKDWNPYYLIPLVEYRLNKIKEAMESTGQSEESDGLKSLKKCLSILEKYKNPYAFIANKPSFMQDGVDYNSLEKYLTKKEDAAYGKYLVKGYKLERAALKDFFKCISNNIDNWGV